MLVNDIFVNDGNDTIFGNTILNDDASNNVDDSYSDVSSSISFVNINCSHVANDSANNDLIDKDDVPYFTLDAVLAMCIADSSSN